jgi:DNA repair exonuclease SbcCD nuclease subunit
MKYAIFSDLHLGVHQNSSNWHNIALDWVDWFVKDLEEKKIKHVIFTGDFFHSRSEISVNTIHVASLLLDKLNKFNVHMIPGNHDCYYKDKSEVHSLSILKGYSNIKIYDNLEAVHLHDGRTVTFCPWGIETEDIQECDVIFGHFEIESFKMNSYKLCETGHKASQLLQKAGLVFTGHFHYREEREYKEGNIIYVGCPFELDFSDRDTIKGYYILDTKDLTYNFVENKLSPKHKKLVISELAKKYSDGDGISEEVANRFIKLVLDKYVNQDDLDKLTAKLASYKPLSLLIDPVVNFSYFADASDSDQDLSGIDISKAVVEFINMMEINNKQDVINYTLELYTQSK